MISGKTGLHQNISPSSQGWISAGSGVRGVVFSLAASRTYGRAEVYIDRGDGEENMFIYDQLHAQKDGIEAAFGGDLTWDPLEGKRACRIKSEMAGNIFDRDQWPATIDFMTSTMVRMENAFKGPARRNQPKATDQGEGVANPSPHCRGRGRKLTESRVTVARFSGGMSLRPVRCRSHELH